MITASLISFVNDFNLLDKMGTVVFEGHIHFITVEKIVILQSPIHFIHLHAKKLDVIYLLNPDFSKQAIPDRVDSNSVIGYYQNRALFTNGSSQVHGDYTLLILPN